MRICIISTGDEILRGTIADTNAAWMASRLHERGHRVDRILAVGDDVDAIASALRAAYGEYDLVVVGGGLGPTGDDVTAAAAALASGVPLERREEAERQVGAVFERMGRRMHEVNLKQADLPSGCTLLENADGTAPGFSVKTPLGRAVFLPGVPSELRRMFERHVLSALPAPERPVHRAMFRCFGIGESDLGARLAPVAAARPGLRLGFRVAFPEIGLYLSTPDAGTLAAAVDDVRGLLGAVAFAEEEIGLPEALGRALASRGLTVAAAESCTGGLVGHSLTEVPGSSRYFLGSAVCYSNEAKIRLLGVDAGLIAAHGAVSEEVARAMAERARRLFGADVGLGVSGIAGPDGGTDEKPAGLVHLAVARPGGTDHASRVFRGFDRSRVKRAAAWTVMAMALEKVRAGS